MAAIAWYGPLIDLSKAPSSVGDFVQLIVFVHRSTPVQYKLSKGGTVIRTDIQVGDDSRPFFSISLWQKQMGAMVFAGDVILLQNVKITKFGDTVEARSVHCSSLLSLVHPYEQLISKGLDELIADCRLGLTAKEKLRKVIQWVQQAGSTPYHVHPDHYQRLGLTKNWKVREERISRDFLSISEVLHLSNSCGATFYASIGEIFLPYNWNTIGDFEKERMFISRRFFTLEDNNIIEDLICTGCQLCGSPLDSDSATEQNRVQLYCPQSSNHLHVVCLIYQPFMLYVWDESEYIPLLVRNKAAECLFGNTKAERVHSSYKKQKGEQNAIPKAKLANSYLCADKKLEPDDNHENPNYYMIWIILLKLLVQQGKNSPLKFEITVNANLERENGRFEMVNVLMPFFKTNGYPLGT